MLCGLGRRDGRTIAYAAQTGRPNTAAGFRTVTRLVRLAERFRLPVLTLIDTPGAAHGASAERGGIGTAIGETLEAMTELSVPVTSVVIGEGGSGGALALAGPGALWATSDSYFSVIAPEGAASILYRDVARASDVAGLLRLAPADLVELGVIDGIWEADGVTSRCATSRALCASKQFKSSKGRALKTLTQGVKACGRRLNSDPPAPVESDPPGAGSGSSGRGRTLVGSFFDRRGQRVVGVEQWVEIRRLHRVDGVSIREISRRTGLHRKTVGWGGIAAPGFVGSRRDSLPSPGSSHQP